MAWIGDSVNLSARMMSKAMDHNRTNPAPAGPAGASAPLLGAIFSDKATSDLASSDLTFDNMGSFVLKGKGSTPAYKLRGLKQRGSILEDTKDKMKATLTLPSTIYDNLANVHSSIMLDYALVYVRYVGVSARRHQLARPLRIPVAP